MQNPTFITDAAVAGTYVIQCVATNSSGASDPDVDRENCQQPVIVKTQSLGLQIPGKYQWNWSAYTNASFVELEENIGGGTDSKQLKVTSADTTEGYLQAKIQATSGITETLLNAGGNEVLQLTPTYGTTANTVCQGNDSRLTDSRTPSGSASGDLSGTYPSPAVAALTASGTQLTLGSVTTGQVLTRVGATVIGTRAGIVKASVTDTEADELTDKLSVANGLSKTLVNSGGNEYLRLEPSYGSSANTVCQGNDSRLSDSRAPSGSASGDLGSSYPSPTVLAVTASGIRLTFGSISDGQLLTRAGTTIVGSNPSAGGGGGGGAPSGPAGGDLSGTYPSPQVASATASGVQLDFNSISDGQFVIRDGDGFVGTDRPRAYGTAEGDLSGSYPAPTVPKVTASGIQLTFGSISSGQILSLNGTNLVGANRTKPLNYGRAEKTANQSVVAGSTTVLTELSFNVTLDETRPVVVGWMIPTDSGSATANTRMLLMRVNSGTWIPLGHHFGAFGLQFEGSYMFTTLTAGTHKFDFALRVDGATTPVLGGGTEIFGGSGHFPKATTYGHTL